MKNIKREKGRGRKEGKDFLLKTCESVLCYIKGTSALEQKISLICVTRLKVDIIFFDSLQIDVIIWILLSVSYIKIKKRSNRIFTTLIKERSTKIYIRG